jgi:hypothetical protein
MNHAPAVWYGSSTVAIAYIKRFVTVSGRPSVPLNELRGHFFNAK